MKTQKIMSREKLPFRITKNGLEPSNGHTARRLKERGYRVGDLVMCVITKPRNPGFHRLAHKLGDLCVRNIVQFENLNAHTVLKRLQWESGAGCEEIGAMIPNVGMTQIRIPKSLSYENMDQGEYSETVKVLCRHISEKYWPDLTPEQVQQMAEVMPDE